MASARKVAVVVGASRGIGRAIALMLAQNDYHVVLAASGRDIPNAPSTLWSVEREIEAMGRVALAVQTNIIEDGAPEALLQRVVDSFDRLDVIVWAASALYPFPIGKLRPKDIALMYKISAIAPLTAVNAALPHLRKQGGRIVFFAPPVRLEAASGGGATYLASKWPQIACAMEVNKEKDVRADCVWPDFLVDTLATTLFPPECKRKPELTADAVGGLLDINLDDERLRYRYGWSETELMKIVGVTDLSSYDVVPGSNPPPLCKFMAERGWEAGVAAAQEFMVGLSKH